MNTKFIKVNELKTMVNINGALDNNDYFYSMKSESESPEYIRIKKSLLLNTVRDRSDISRDMLFEFGYKNLEQKLGMNKTLAVEVESVFSRDGMEEEEIIKLCRYQIEFLRTYFNLGYTKTDNVVDVFGVYSKAIVRIVSIVIPIDEKNKINYLRFIKNKGDFLHLRYKYENSFDIYKIKNMEEQITELHNELMGYKKYRRNIRRAKERIKILARQFIK